MISKRKIKLVFIRLCMREFKKRSYIPSPFFFSQINVFDQIHNEQKLSVIGVEYVENENFLMSGIETGLISDNENDDEFENQLGCFVQSVVNEHIKSKLGEVTGGIIVSSAKKEGVAQ